MNKAVYFIWSAVLLGVDQAIKHVVRLMPEGEPFFRCPPLFELERVTNTGVAFSLFSSRQGIVVLLPAALMLLLCVYQAREKDAFHACASGDIRPDRRGTGQSG